MITFNELINKLELLETDSGDIAGVSSRLGSVEKRIVLNTNNNMFKYGKYVARTVKNSDELHSHFKKQGIDILPTKDLHSTIAYSRKDFPHELDESNISVHPKDISGFDLFGDNKNVLVMKFNSKELHERHNETIKNGAMYDYDSYKPHITLNYDYTVDISKLEKPNFPIILNNEYQEGLDEGKH
jgi:hypothetical protein